MIKKISARKQKYSLDKKSALEIHKRIFEENSKAVIADVFPVAVMLALQAKHGIVGAARLSDKEISEMKVSMAPLLEILDIAAIKSGQRIFTEFHTDPIWRQYFLKKSAVAMAKESASLSGLGGAPGRLGPPSQDYGGRSRNLDGGAAP